MASREIYRAILLAALLAGCSKPTGQRLTTAARETSPCATATAEVLTEHNDCFRSGASLHETVLTPASIANGSFGRLFEWPVDGQIYAQPLYATDVSYRSPSTHETRQVDMVIVATMNNSIYAFEAPPKGTDKLPAQNPLWHKDSRMLGKPLNYWFLPMWSAFLGYNIRPLIGVTSTPVIDKGRNSLYLTSKFDDGHCIQYALFRLDLSSGDSIGQPHVIDPGCPAAARRFDARYHLQRPALLEINARIYVAFGSHQDTDPYHGYVFAFDADTLNEVGRYCTTCEEIGGKESKQGGIWQAGGGPVADGQGNVYVITGNGPFTTTKDGNRGTSFIKLDADARFLGSWTPANYACLARTDTDLGSAGPMFLPQYSLIVGGGKEGVLYGLKPDALKGIHVGPGIAAGIPSRPCKKSDPLPARADTTFSSVQAAPLWNDSFIMDFLRFIQPFQSQGYHHIHGSPVRWDVRTDNDAKSFVYVSAERDRLRAYEIGSDGVIRGNPPGHDPNDENDSTCANSDHGMPGGFLTVSADGGKQETGIIWASMPRYNQNALTETVPGVLRAFKAYPEGDGRHLTEIWNSDFGLKIGPCKSKKHSGLDQVGYFAKFVAPTVADGRVYLATFSNKLAVYGLRTARLQALFAEAATYSANLNVREIPKRPPVGEPLAISVTVENTGQRPWRASDSIGLGSPTMPVSEYTPVEGLDRLEIGHDVAPGEKYTFSFRMSTPSVEQSRYVSWQLRRNIDGAAQATDWIGEASPEQKVWFVKPACDNVRERATALSNEIRDLYRSGNEMQDEAMQKLGPAVSALQNEANENNCSLDSGLINPQMSDESDD